MREPEFEDDVPALDLADVAQPLSKRIEDQRLVAVCKGQDADAGIFDGGC